MLSTKTRRLLLFHFLVMQFTDLWLTLPKIQGHFNGFIHVIHSLMFGLCLFIRAVDLVKKTPMFTLKQGTATQFGSLP